ncbi:MAG: TetR/AcrR family transcriptional regulator [Lachnospiraceae bacterium]
MPKYSDTQRAIMDAGKQEFLEKGYKGANLRSIAAKAGVTTGAIYGYFADKQELFRCLVEPVASDFYGLFEQALHGFGELPAQEQVDSMHTYSDHQLGRFFDYIYEHFDIFRLIKCCSSGTEYEHYIDKMVEVETACTRLFITILENRGFTPALLSDNLIHILANAYFSAIFEVVEHNMEKQEAQAYIGHITTFFSAGWDVLLKYNNQPNEKLS